MDPSRNIYCSSERSGGCADTSRRARSSQFDGSHRLPAYIILVAVALSTILTQIYVTRGATVTLSVNHKVDQGSTVSSAAKYASSRAYSYDKYEETVGRIPSGIEYSSSQLKRNIAKGEVEIPYFIRVSKEVAPGTYRFEVTYNLYELGKQQFPALTLVVYFTIDVTEPFSIQKIHVSYWIVSAIALITCTLGIFAISKSEHPLAQVARIRLRHLIYGLADSGTQILGVILFIVGLFLVAGNLSGAFPTIPFAGFITTGIGYYLMSRKRSLRYRDVSTRGIGERKIVSKGQTLHFCPRCGVYLPPGSRGCPICRIDSQKN